MPKKIGGDNQIPKGASKVDSWGLGSEWLDALPPAVGPETAELAVSALQFPQQQMGFGVPSPQQPFPGQPAKQAQQSPHSTFFQQQQMMPQQMAALSPNQVAPPSSQLSPTVAPQKLPSEMATSSPGQPLPQNTVQVSVAVFVFV